MRTTLTLDDDVAAKLKAEARRLDCSYREVVNETLRRGLATQRASASGRGRFKIAARDLGRLHPGLSLDSISELIGQTEGAFHR